MTSTSLYFPYALLGEKNERCHSRSYASVILPKFASSAFSFIPSSPPYISLVMSIAYSSQKYRRTGLDKGSTPSKDKAMNQKVLQLKEIYPDWSNEGLHQHNDDQRDTYSPFFRRPRLSSPRSKQRRRNRCITHQRGWVTVYLTS